MKSNTLLILAVVAFVAAFGGCLALIGRYTPGLDLLSLFLGLTVVLKLTAMLTVLLIVLAVILTLAKARGVLGVVAGLSVGLGLLGALYEAMMIQTAVKAMGGPVSFETTAPTWAEALSVLSLGLFGAVVALAGRAWTARRG